MATSFSFRQRVGKIDWKAVTSVNISEVILKLKVTELQQVLDHITFCEFTGEDVKTNSVGSVASLIVIMQLTIEYLLHCQEAQFKLLRELEEKKKKLKETNEKIHKDNVSLKEDTRIYQRQLFMLRKSIQNSQGLPNDYSSIIPPKLVNLNQNNENKSNKENNEIVTSFLAHDKENRVFISTMMEEQRRAFKEEMYLLTDSLRAITNNFNNNNTNNAGLNGGFAGNNMGFDKLLEEINKKIEVAVASAVQSTNPVKNKEKGKSLDVASILEASALEVDLEEFEGKLRRKEERLREKENVMRERERALINREKAADELRRESIEQKTSMRENELQLQLNDEKERASKAESKLKELKREIENQQEEIDLLKQTEKAIKSQLKRENEELTYREQSKTRRESELQAQLEGEKEKAMLAQLKNTSLLRDLEMIQAELQSTRNSSRNWEERERQLVQDLSKAKEEALIQQARFNNLRNKISQEKSELEEKLKMAEETATSALKAGMRNVDVSSSRNADSIDFVNSRIRDTKEKRDSSMMTSLDFAGVSLRKSVNIRSPERSEKPDFDPRIRHSVSVATGKSISTGTEGLEDLKLAQEIAQFRKKEARVDPFAGIDLPLRFLDDNITDEELFNGAQQRIAYRADEEEMELKAMESLARDFQLNYVQK